MNIKAKLLVTITTLVVFLGVVIMMLVSTYLYDRLVEEVQERGVVIGNNLALRSIDPILTGDLYRLSTLLADQKETQESVEYAFVTDSKGKVLADTFDGNFPVDLLHINSLAANDEYRITSFQEGASTHYDIAINVLHPPLATVHLGIPEAPIRDDVLNIINPIILTILVALILSTIVAYIFAKYITRPISALADSVDAIRNGDFDKKAAVDTNDEVGRLACAFNEMLDELNTTLTQLADSERMFRLMSNSAHDAVVMVDHNGLITVWNEAAMNLFGYSAQEAVGQEMGTIIRPENMSSKKATRLARYITSGIGKAHGEKLELQILTKQRTQILVEVSLSRVQVKGKWNTVGIARDITQQKQLEDRLTRLSYMDGLTNIHNRRSFDEHIIKECKRAQREQLPISIFMIDIDFFKNYNDTYGHNAGDDCLIQVADAIKKSLKRSGDFLARYGGEEFAIIAPNTDKEGAIKLAENIRLNVAAMKIAHASSKASNVVTCSVGVCTNILDKSATISANHIISQADKALYRAKNSGRNRSCIY